MCPWKALIGHPKADFLDIDDDVDAESSEKRQGWAFIAFIEGEEGVNQGEYHQVISALLPHNVNTSINTCCFFVSLYMSSYDYENDL